MTLAETLDSAVRRVCPIIGVSIGDESDRKSWIVQFTEGATETQVKAGVKALAEFIWPAQPPPVESVSARQFKLQLLAAGLLDAVDGWIATQSKAVQIAYEYSGTFVRTEPMMSSGFAAMGFTEEQIDAFFAAASKL